ncbi:MAG: HIT family protein [Lachnospiraceae bacterium]|nr:HIT family protein [Lachnospiraceae bacterium]
MKKDDCIFCRIANGEIPSRTVYEDYAVRVILDLSPSTRGHALILPKDHFDDLYEISDEYLIHIAAVSKKVALLMKERLGTDGLNIIQNNGETAGQTVRHYHMHCIPRYQGDGQEMLWEPHTLPDGEMDEILKKLTD